jgi:EAL and modified HD-GYP domain-containing signal transduction protein
MSHTPLLQEDSSLEPVFVARQPVFQKDMGIWGYELLFRGEVASSAAHFQDPETATSKVIADGFAIAQAGMAPETKVLINFTERMIKEDAPFALPAGHVVEILEDVPPSAEILRKCHELKTDYLLAMDDYTGHTGYDALINLVDIIKIDVLHMDHEKVARVVNELRPFSGLLLAEKVEDHAMFELTRDMGFDLFQGFFFSKPITVSGKKLGANEISKLELLRELEKSHFDPQVFSEIIQKDVAISYRLLSSLNSPGMNLLHRVQSISHAVRLLGERRVRQWVRILIMADFASSSINRELVQLSATRACFLGELAKECTPPFEQDTMFLLGLFSLLDTILNQDMAQALSHLSLDSAVMDTLLGERTKARDWLDLAVFYEHGKWESVDHLTQELGVSHFLVAKTYSRALGQSCQLLGEDF